MVVVSIAVLAACRSANGGAPINPETSVRHTLSAADLEGTPFASMLEAVQTLRGEWLRQRGPNSFNFDVDVIVYLDGNRLGGRGALRTIPTAGVTTVRFMSPPEAQSYFGLSHPNGAILVSTKL